MMFDPSLTALPLNSRIDKAINSALAQGRLIGTVVVVSHGGRRVYQRAAGHMNRETETPMPINALFRLASVTKLFTAVAALSLVEDRVINLQDAVTDYLPDFQPLLSGKGQVTIRLEELLLHTSGLGYGFDGGAEGLYRQLGISDGLDLAGVGSAQTLERLNQAPLYTAPGSRWRYSLGLDVLGWAMEAATGQGLADIVRQRITEPMGLTDTGFTVVDEARLTTAYATLPEGIVPMTSGIEVPTEGDVVRFDPDRFRDPASFASGGAGLIGSADDVMGLLEGLRTGGQTILPAARTESLFEARVGPKAQTRGPGWGFGYGGAVLVEPEAVPSPQGAGTMAWGGVYGHNWFIDRAHEISLVCLTNTAFEGMNGQLVTDLRNAVYGWPT